MSTFDIGAVGTGVATSIIGDIANTVMGDEARRKQIDAANNQSIFNKEQQIDLFNKTGYEAQVQQMKNAGLNPSIMYAKGGTGGSTALATGKAEGNYTPSNSNKIMEVANQTAMAQAQIEGIKAKARLDNTTADKLGGVDTNKTITETESIAQGITNQKTINALNEVQKQIAEVELEIDQRTKEINIQEIGSKANEALGKAKSAMTQGNVDENTYQTKIKTIEQAYTNLALEQGAIESGIELTNEQIEQVKGLTQNYIEQIKLGKSGQEIQKEYQDSLIKLGYTKVIADGITNVANIATKGMTGTAEKEINTTTFQKTTDNKGNWRKTQTTQTRK